jgi:regulator of protease activity HflC (stomatin/prohibitin superfamily)
LAEVREKEPAFPSIHSLAELSTWKTGDRIPESDRGRILALSGLLWAQTTREIGKKVIPTQFEDLLSQIKKKVVKGATIVIVAVVALIIVLVAGCSAVATPDANKIMVVRNGGPLDNRAIRQVVPPGSGITWIGLFSTVHQYPSIDVQRFYTITADPTMGDRLGVDVVHVPSKDGVNLGVEGTFYFATAFDGTEKGKKLAASFDDHFGTRTYAAPDGGHYALWSGDAGWSAWLDAIIRPVLENELRSAIGDFTCSDLLSSCALVQNSNATASSVIAAGSQNKENIQKVESAINKDLIGVLKATLGDNYLANVRFTLVRVKPPEQVQTAIDEVQASRVLIAKTAAEVQQATNKQLAARKLAEVYRSTPELAQIEMIKLLPKGTNVFFGINPTVVANK